MKKLLLTLLVALSALFSFAQAPYLMNYQGVARNAAGNVIPNKSIGLRLSVLTGSATGTAVYVETRTVVTNAFGLFNVALGGPGSTSTIGTLTGINWAQSGTKYLQVELDPEGGSSYVNVGATQMLSTPFTLYANVAGDLILPFTKTQAENGYLFRVTNTGTLGTSSAIEGLTTSSAANVYGIKGTISSTSPGTLSAGVVGQNNGSGASGIGVMGQHSGNGWGVYGTATGGTGVYGNSTTGTGVYGQSVAGNSVTGFQPNTGAGSAGLFQNTNTSNVANNLFSSTNGAGDAFQSAATGTGKAASLLINNPANGNMVLVASTNGMGTVGSFQNTNSSNVSTVVDVNSTGLGKGLSVVTDNAANANNVVTATTNGLGSVAALTNLNNSNNSAVLNVATTGSGTGALVTTTGTGKGVSLVINNAVNTSDVLTATTNGTGVIGNLFNTNANNSSTVLSAATNGTGTVGNFSNTNNNNGSNILNVTTNGTGTAALVTTTGTGKGASVVINNAASSSTAFSATTNGTGSVGNLFNTNGANGSDVLAVSSNGTGIATNINSTNNANNSSIVNVNTNGAGEAVTVAATGTGKGGSFTINNSGNSNNVLSATTNGTGTTGSFTNTNAANNSNVLTVGTNGLGRTAVLQNTNTANANNTLEINTNGTGFAANITNTNATPKALKTTGAIQFTGIGESLNKVLSTDNNGNATWNSAAAVGIVTGSGTSNYLPKWQPSGTGLVNSQVFDNGTNVGVGTNIPNNRLDVLTTASDDGFKLHTSSTGNVRFRMTNSTGKEYSLLVGGSTSGFGNGNLVITDITSSDAPRFLINGNTGNIAIGGGSNLTPAEKLWVNGNGRFKSDLDVEKSVHVTDSVNSGRLLVKGNAADYLAIFSNTNTSDGGGIQIKLGKTNPMWDGNAWVGIPIPAMPGLGNIAGQIKGWAYGAPFDISDMIKLSPSTWIPGTVATITNFVKDQINDALNLPIHIGPYGIPKTTLIPKTVIIGETDFGFFTFPELAIPEIDFPALTIVPSFDIVPKIPDIPTFGLPSLSWPNLRVTDVANSMNQKSEFINFADKDGKKMGSVTGQSISDFYNNYFDAIKIAQLMDQMVGIDLLKDIFGVFAGIVQTIQDYNEIGVQYSSGHGDYAEWLERADANESITAGDIVAIKGGKITKDLTGAEQIMAVSHKPIVLGNSPEKDKEGLGNTVAFMGQIPVKVMGAVASGDYIVARSNIAGYGIAVHPNDMTIEDHKLVVGRSWVTSPNDGPKVVNTVVGVVNNGFLNIINDLKKKAELTDSRLKAIEDALQLKTAAKTTIKNKTTN